MARPNEIEILNEPINTLLSAYAEQNDMTRLEMLVALRGHLDSELTAEVGRQIWVEKLGWERVAEQVGLKASTAWDRFNEGARNSKAAAPRLK